MGSVVKWNSKMTNEHECVKMLSTASTLFLIQKHLPQIQLSIVYDQAWVISAQ